MGIDRRLLPLLLLPSLLRSPHPACGGGVPLQLSRAADQLAEEGRHAEAVAKYRAALGLGSSPMRHAEVATFNLGLSLVELDRHGEASAAFEATLGALQGLPPRHQRPERVASVHVALAEALTHAPADWGKAARHFGAAASLVPSDATARYNAGSALFNLRRQLLRDGTRPYRARLRDACVRIGRWAQVGARTGGRLGGRQRRPRLRHSPPLGTRPWHSRRRSRCSQPSRSSSARRGWRTR